MDPYRDLAEGEPQVMGATGDQGGMRRPPPPEGEVSAARPAEGASLRGPAPAHRGPLVYLH